MAKSHEVPDEFDDSMLGCAVVECPGCGAERWYGHGPCRQCGVFLPGSRDA